VVATRLNLECFEQVAVELRKLEVCTVVTGLSAVVKVVVVTMRLSLGSFEWVGVKPCKLAVAVANLLLI